MSLKVLNQPPGATVFIPDTLIFGQSSEDHGIIEVRHHNDTFPPQYFEVNGGYFKLLVHLQQGENHLWFTQHAGTYRNGYPHFDQNPHHAPFSLQFSLQYKKLPNATVNLCLLVAKDSPLQFDAPSGMKNDLDSAIKRMKFCARLMQAFTAEQMRRNGFGNRCFQFTEAFEGDTISKRDIGTVRDTVKIHVITLDQTVSEIRDPDVAQQNPNAHRNGDLFGFAGSAIEKYKANHPELGESWNVSHIQAACIYLDAHWDAKKKLLLGHAALGGSIGNTRLAIFGSHGLWSWPECYEDLYHSFSDCTATDTSRVVNDLNECGTAWESLNVSLGAFLHEIGHALGCPHQPNGVMRRDYVTLNRTYMTREFPSTRTGSHGYAPVLPDQECTWNRLDIMRFVYHPSFRLPIDLRDPSIDLGAWDNGEEPSVQSSANQSMLIISDSGIYLIELHVDGDPRAQIEFLPQMSNSGKGPQKYVTLTYSDLQSRLPPEFRNKKLKLEILAQGMKQTTVEDYLEMVAPIRNDFGLGRGTLEGYATGLHGNPDGKKTLTTIVGAPLAFVRIYHSGALYGVEFFYHQGGSRLVGAREKNYEEFKFDRNESIVQFNIRCGAWLDAISIVTNQRKTPLIGNSDGGHGAELVAPPGHYFVALEAYTNEWIRGLRAIYVAGSADDVNSAQYAAPHSKSSGDHLGSKLFSKLRLH